MRSLASAAPAVHASVRSAASPSVALDAVFRFANDARCTIRHLDLRSRDIVLGECDAWDDPDSGYAFPLCIRPLEPAGSMIDVGVVERAAIPAAVIQQRLEKFLQELKRALPRAPTDA